MERSKPLHNFNLPEGLTWGRQRALRFGSVNPIRAMPDDDHNSSDSDHYVEHRPIENNRVEASDDTYKTTFRVKVDNSSGEENEISATREKIMNEYRSEIVKMQKSILKGNNPIEGMGEPSSPSPLDLKLKQKLTLDAPPPPPPFQIGGDGGSGINEEFDFPRSETKLLRPRRNAEKKEERPKFSLTLSRKEIEEDFIAMTGKKPPRKPTKRPKGVQAELNALFPGSYLCEINADRYKVNENGKI